MIKVMKGARKTKLLAFTFALAVLMGLGTASVAFAEPAPIPVDPNSYAEITKVLERPMGVHMPSAENPADGVFTFSATPSAFNGGPVGGTIFPPINPVVLTTEDGVLPDAWVDTVPEALWGIKSVERSVRFDLSTLVFNAPGQFDYVVTQEAETTEDFTNANEEYTLRLRVEAVDGENAITNVSFLNAAGVEAPARFTSIYTPYGSFIITTLVDGAYANEGTDFNFRVRLTRTKFVEEGATVEALIVPTGGGAVSLHEITYDRWYDFSLRHRWEMIFDELPLGTAFMVEERAATNYIPTVDVVINGSMPFSFTAEGPDRALSSESALGLSFLVENRVIGADENKVTFTNYMAGTPTSHILWDNIWIIAAAGMAFLFFVAFVIWVRKRG